MLSFRFPADTRSKAIAYWIVTALVVFENILGGVWDIWRTPYVRVEMVRLGYPLYVLTILGIWKLLGAIAILIPRFPRLKEWAYAGMFFEYSGAAVSQLLVGGNFFRYVTYPLFVIILVAVSWGLRPAVRRGLATDRWHG